MEILFVPHDIASPVSAASNFDPQVHADVIL